MAERRMFSKAVINSARFLTMPPSSRLLYYDLGMVADDDGIVEAFTVIRTTGAVEDDLRVLISKGFVSLLNDELVAYITDWNKNNQIRKDRYQPSIYQNLLVKLGDGDQRLTNGLPSGNQRSTQVSIGKDRIEKANNSLVSPDGSTKVKQTFEPDSLPYRAARWLADQIEERLPNCTPYSETTLQSWAADFDKCHRLDGHAWEDVNEVLQFSQADPFWSTNILSAGKFRKQYTQLLAKMGGSQ